ncbi:helix-turn-helix domain-containing protein [Kitasatospora sp. MY 5-36]|uniref:helix-turn-helix domain-containing protein n=1 Tax=Kitasatospora sp. MY 5-36 TaxID=1678027 RepID=UPI000671703D|nr:helix-turn-helix domain-containing protein [Kitasatospora sp. MY 5-36]
MTHPPADDIRLLTIADATALLRLTKLTVYRLVHSDDLSAIRTGNAWYVPRDAALDYLHTLDVAQPRD